MSDHDKKAALLLAAMEGATDEALQSVLPWVVFPLLGGLPHDDLPFSVIEFFEGFSAQLGVGPHTTKEEMRDILDHYRKVHPVDPELMTTLLGIARDELTGGGTDALGRAFANLIDAEPGHTFIMRSGVGDPIEDE